MLPNIKTNTRYVTVTVAIAYKVPFGIERPGSACACVHGSNKECDVLHAKS